MNLVVVIMAACLGLWADTNEKFRHACRDGNLIKARKYYEQSLTQPELYQLDVNAMDKVSGGVSRFVSLMR